MYEGFALIEEHNLLAVHEQFKSAADKLKTAIVQMEALTLVQERWNVRDSYVFSALLSELSVQIGFVPTGDRAVIDHLISELYVLSSALEMYAQQPLYPYSPNGISESSSPKPIPVDPEGQANLIRGILIPAIRLQRIGLLVTQISTVT